VAVYGLLEDTGLPPRYGIVTSNSSESMNNLFAKAREGLWPFAIDNILGLMVNRISRFWEGHHGKTGVVVTKYLTKMWEKSAGFQVDELKPGGKSSVWFRNQERRM
jgi:hypothetical protein